MYETDEWDEMENIAEMEAMEEARKLDNILDENHPSDSIEVERFVDRYHSNAWGCRIAGTPSDPTRGL
jgi:hypothetical protein